MEGSARLASNLEELHGLNGLGELLRVFDADDSRVEWSGDVLSDLRLLLEDDSGLLFKGDGNLSGVGLFLRKVIQVDEVLGWVGLE